MILPPSLHNTGSLQAGSVSCRLRNAISITLHGSRGGQPLPADPTVKGVTHEVNGACRRIILFYSTFHFY